MNTFEEFLQESKLPMTRAAFATKTRELKAEVARAQEARNAAADALGRAEDLLKAHLNTDPNHVAKQLARSQKDWAGYREQGRSAEPGQR